MKKIIPAIIVLSIVLLAACTKTEETPAYEAPDTPSELIQNGGWIMSGARYKIDNGDWVDFYSSFPECVSNNVLSFPTDEVFVKDEGATKCSPTDIQKIEDGNWYFKWNEAKLVFTTPIFDTAVSVYDTTEQILLSLTEDQMKIMYTEGAGPTGIRTNEITYRH